MLFNFVIKRLSFRMRIFLAGCMLVLSTLAVAQPAELILADLDNREHRLSDHRGKWVVVNYWATWCPPCIEEMPELVFFHDRHKDKDAIVIGVNMEDAPDEKVREFLDEHLITYPVWLSEPVRQSPLGGVPGLPTTFIVSPEGKVVHRVVGRISLEYLEKVIQEKR